MIDKENKEIPNNIAVLFCALYISEIWYGKWRLSGDVYAKARAMVIFDRILSDDRVG